jgi:hypothetical protein
MVHYQTFGYKLLMWVPNPFANDMMLTKTEITAITCLIVSVLVVY